MNNIQEIRVPIIIDIALNLNVKPVALPQETPKVAAAKPAAKAPAKPAKAAAKSPDKAKAEHAQKIRDGIARSKAKKAAAARKAERDAAKAAAAEQKPAEQKNAEVKPPAPAGGWTRKETVETAVDSTPTAPFQGDIPEV